MRLTLRNTLTPFDTLRRANMQEILTARSVLPDDGTDGCLVARVWRPGIGPAIAVMRDTGVFDVTRNFPTLADL